MTHNEKMKEAESFFNQCLEVMAERSLKYSPAHNAMENFSEFGWKGICVRLGDKWARVRNMAKRGWNYAPEEADCPIDSFIDMANYAALAVIQKDLEDKELQNGKE
jgi:hypothetical protein